ncbi:MAG: transcription-repair coupling factor [Bacteroides sp.]|nr:transcription-repair coupling factor [Bacillota bacterium]MCM1394105.1 transcription-repair coupling factor [[Eubacterium] siraeum]MCM1455882.1 transcription-repair coupling factor [Bacteroides sp.]
MKIPSILQLKNLGEKLAKLEGAGAKRLSDPKLSAVSVLRVTDGAKAHIISALNCRRLVVTADALGAKSLAGRLASWGARVCYLPYRDDMLMSRKGFTQDNMLERMNTLVALNGGDVDIVVTCADSLLQHFPSRRLVEKYAVTIKKEDVISPVELADRLALAGYVRRDVVGDVGEFSLRGDVLDVYSPSKIAYRVGFFDELIEDIKVFDVESMASSNEVEKLTLPPMSDILADENILNDALAAMKPYLDSKNCAEAREGIRVGACNASAVWALPFMDGQQTLLEYLDDGETTLVIFDEPKVVFDKLNILAKEFEGRIKTLTDGGEILPLHREAYITVHELRRQLFNARKMSFSSMSLNNPLFDPTYVLEPKTKAVTKYYLDPSAVANDVKAFMLNGAKVIFACGNSERAKGVAESLREDEISAEFSEDGEGDGSVLVTPLKVDTGVIYPAAKAVIIGVSECIGKKRAESVISQKRQFSAPKAGDYVVHRVHGVGLCEGTTRMKSGEFEREYIVLKYRDGDTLYVATDQMNNLQKFVGEENPTLNKLGGKEFEREKERVKKSVRKLAVNLVELYAKREKQKGYKYSEDTVWQKEFEDSFEYVETDDQLKAIAEIKQDMEQGRIMDRLVVGDVGFGKTEVAFRAMFKTVLDGKQAVLLAPTTILARQHYENLVDRLKPFGIRCGLLTRLQSSAENAKLLKDLKDGSAHIVIATHKVLSKNVEFYDLGLLVLDEEQRFGVEHKEKLKEKYPLVNVLTLSATPIPRTLNMSLSGLRDISMLETAPQGRLPIQTYVVSYSDAICVDAITREIARGGQTLILLNDIERLKPFADRLAGLVDGARIITAHGQMPAGQLEERMSAFYDKQYDVLVATTIIENGIDLPDANTLIVIDSGNFGLSQLYQLRGRVGRRGALAHAYFTLPESGTLTATAEKRLKTLLENTEIGSGFRVAMSDLSIRGAGTLLGAEQSGHIEKVGYEMYLELLDEAVQEIKTGVVRKPERDVEMRVDAMAFISDGYVSSRDKLRVYKRISEIRTKAARDALVAELAEVYGPVDVPLENLINIALLKNLAARFDVSRVVINKNGAGANFYDADVFKNELLMRAVADNASSVVMTTTIPPTLIFEVNKKTAEQKLARMIDFFSVE